MKKYLDLLKQLSNLSLLAVFCLSPIFSIAQDPSAEIKKADLLADHGKKKGAIESLQNAIKTYPDAAQLYYYLGQAQLNVNDQAGAKASFEKGAQLNPKEQLNQVGLAQILVLEKKAAQAKPILDKALSSSKKNVPVLQAIARALILDKSMSKEALPILQKAKEINNSDAETYILLGDYYLGENQGGPCASAYEDAAALDGTGATAHHKHAMLFKRTHNTPVVEEDLKKAIQADPDFALAYKELARLYYLKNDGKNAVKYQEGYLKLTDSPEEEDRFQLAFFYFSAKDYVKANAEFKALAQKPDVTPMTLRFYAKSLTESGNLDEAEKVFKSYMATKKDSVKAVDYLNLGTLQKKQGKDSLWAISLETAVTMDPTPTQQTTLESLVAYYFKARKFGPCAAACTKLNKIKKQPDANVYFTQGKSYVAIKQYPSADTAFAKVIELKPAYVQGYLWAAKSKNAQDGKLDEKDSKVEWLAKPFYDKVVEQGELDRENNKKELTEAYQYLTSYYLTKQDLSKGKEAVKKILEINPDDKDAQDLLKQLDQPVQQKPKRK